MKRKIAVAGACLLIPLIACANEERASAETPVIARVGEKEIRYREIRCPERFQTPPEDSRCHEIEQQKLDALMTTELIEAAARIHGIAVSEEEVLAAAPKGAVPSDAQLQQTDLQFKALAKAVLMVRDGASPDEVFARELAPKGIARPFFDSVNAKWSREAAQKALTTDYIAEGKRQVIAQHRTLLLLRRIKELAAARQSKRGLSPEEAWREFWREVIDRSDTKIVDPRYSLPDMERL